MAREEASPLEEAVYRLLSERANLLVYLDRRSAAQMEEADKLFVDYVSEAVASRNRRLFRASEEKAAGKLYKGLGMVSGLYEDVKKTSPYKIVWTLERIIAYLSRIEKKLSSALEELRGKMGKLDEKGKIAVRYGNESKARELAHAKKVLLARYMKLEAMEKKFSSALERGGSLLSTLKIVVPQMLRIDDIVFEEDLEEPLMELKDIMGEVNVKMQNTFDVLDKIEKYLDDVFGILSEAKKTPEVEDIIEEWASAIEAEAAEFQREVRKLKERKGLVEDD